jgi:hypothetical protein
MLRQLSQQLAIMQWQNQEQAALLRALVRVQATELGGAGAHD